MVSKKSKTKAIALSALIASTATAAVVYANKDSLKNSNDANVEIAKLLVDKIDKDTVKVSIENVNHAAKAFQLSLMIDGNVEFKGEESSIKWLTNIDTGKNGTESLNTQENKEIERDYILSDDKKSIDIFVTSNSEIERKGSIIEVCEIDLSKASLKSNSDYSIVPSLEEGKMAYKSVDVNNKSVEAAVMDYDVDNILKFNTPPTIVLVDSVEDTNITIENNMVTIKEGQEFVAKDFVIISDEEDKDISKNNIVVTDEEGNEIPESKNDFKTGTHKINYTVTDSDNESTSISLNLIVEPNIWKEAPTIIGVPKEVMNIYTGDVFDVYAPEGTKVTATDAIGNSLEVSISGEFDLDVAGEYQINYIAKDRFDNTKTETLNLIVEDNEMPVITFEENTIINRGQGTFDPLAGVIATDDGEEVSAENIKILGNVDTNIGKKYTLLYEIDDNKNPNLKTVKQRIVTVNGEPTIYGNLSYMIVSKGQSISDAEILDGVVAEDDLDENISLTLDRKNLNTSVEGTYTVQISATDSNGLTSTVTKDIVVTSKAIIELPDSGDGYTEDTSKKMQVINSSVVDTINKTLSDMTKDYEVSLSKVTVLDNVNYRIKITENKVAFRNSKSYFVDITVPKTIDDSTGGIVITKHQSIKIESIELSGYSDELKVGDIITLNTTVAPSNAENKDLIWSSTDNTIVSIEPSRDKQSATISALKKGTSTIRVMAADGSGVASEVVVHVGEQPKEDTQPPIFDYKGKTDVILANGSDFEIPFLTASDNIDTGIEVKTTILDSNGYNLETIDTTISGKYKIVYNASDKSQNKAELIINVTVKEPIEGIDVSGGSGESSTKPLIMKTEVVESLNELLKLTKDDGYEAKVYGNPETDEAKNEITYNLRLYKKQNFIDKIFNKNKNEEIYYIKLTLKNSDEFKAIMNELEIVNPEQPGGGGGINPPTVTITDVPKDHWARTEIYEFINLGYIDGYGDNTFRPENNITRAEFVKLVNRVFNFTKSKNVSFSDISSSDWYYKEIAIGVKAGYINGYENNTFKPNQNITREEAAKILAIILEVKGDGKLNFDDSHKISDWAIKYVDALTDNSIIDGYEDNTFRPREKTSRAETVKLLSRSKNKY